jgi:hypothetical protein
MSIVYSILGIIALGLFSVVVLPIFVVVFVVGTAGFVVSLGKSETKKREFEPAAALRSLSLREQAQV